MQDPLDEAIRAHVSDPNPLTLRALHLAFLNSTLIIPLAEPVKKLGRDRYDIPVLSIMDGERGGAVPAFTTLDHLYEWKPQGCLYTDLNGRSLLTMALGMTGILQVLVNPGGAPSGRIPRTDFSRMLLL